MSVYSCPECGHELVGRSRYCQFCGCDLRKSGHSSASDSEKYERAIVSSGKRKTLIVTVFAFLAVVIALACYSSAPAKAPLLPSLKPGMDFDEACAAMNSAGFAKEGSSYRSGTAVCQEYSSRNVYGCSTFMSSLEVQEGPDGHISLMHFYVTDYEKDEGKKLFSQLKGTMSSLYGDPEYLTAVYDYYRWPDDHGYHILVQTNGMIMSGDWLDN